VLLVQVAAVAAIPRAPLAAGAVVLAEVTGRVSVVVATSSPAARPGGFGALVAGRTTAAERALMAGALAVAVAAAGLTGGWFTGGGPALALRGLAAALAGLLAGWLVQRAAVRRLGGMTGDVFGAILQVSATTALTVAALLGLAEAALCPVGGRGCRGEGEQDAVVGDELGRQFLVGRERAAVLLPDRTEQ
jgi:adenosylcobinamide-GDP ribazoletransferase